MRNKLARPRQTSGFTLVELLVVISILASLIGIMMPALNGVRESMWATRSLARVTELTTGIEAFRREYNYYPGQTATVYDSINGDALTGSIVLAQALFPNDEHGVPVAKFAPLNEGDLKTIDNRSNVIWDRYHEDELAAVCYYPADPREDDLDQFKESHNTQHTSGDRHKWLYPKGGNDSKFDQHIMDRRFSDPSTTPYNAGKFLLIAPGRDRIYGTADDNRNFGN